jgi:hypothetical protein
MINKKNIQQLRLREAIANNAKEMSLAKSLRKGYGAL